MATWADRDAVAKAATNWSAAQIRCRSRRQHNWNPYTVTRHTRSGVWTVVERCTRCHNRRRQELSAEGYALTGWRPDKYTANYLMPPKSGRVGPDGIALLRLMDLETMSVIEVDDEEEN